MQDSDGKELSDNKGGVAESDTESTSKETLSDVEEQEAGVESGDSAADAGPSPDGSLDESDEIKDAEPM